MVATIEVPVGGFDLDYQGKQSRAIAVNCYAEGEGDFYSVRRCDGLELFKATTEEFCRSNVILVDGLVYFVAGESLYQLDKVGNLNNLGTVGGAGFCELAANNIPDDSQVLVLNGLGQGYVYQPSTGLNIITDPDFPPASYATVLNERFWLPKDNSNQFAASAVSDGTDYPAGAIATAETSPDNVVAPVAHKGALWVLGENTSEYWQYVNDSTLPVRQVKGVVYERGCAAVHSIRKTGDTFCFLADDLTVMMVSGSQMQKISGLSFELEVKGDGSTRYPGYSKVDDAYGFFIDGPTHKIYYLTFPTESVTWGYDFSTGLWHKRESFGYTRWRPIGAVSAWGKIIVADALSGNIYYLTPGYKTENGVRIDCYFRTPSLSWRTDVTIPLIEVDMETGVGVANGQGSDPKLIIRYSKDGGNTWINKSDQPIGAIGDYRKRVPIRQFGRVVRNRDFVVEVRITDPVEFRIYKMYAQVEEGM